MRVLYLGENWYGSCARACAYALRRLDCDVQDVDLTTFIPQGRSKASRASARLLDAVYAGDYNDTIVRIAERFKPDFLLAFKAQLVTAGALRQVRATGAKLYNYYPDTSAFAHGSTLGDALPEYDCVFFTKKFWERDVRSRVSLKNTVYLPHGYDSEIHRPFKLSPGDVSQHANDVTVIASHMAAKEEILDELLALKPALKLKIWGNRWGEHCRSQRVLNKWMRSDLTGRQYSTAIQAAKINVALMSGKVEGSSQGDQTTTRTFEIPACGGFMLHERNPEVLELFEEDKEIACFGSVRELGEKIDYYLSHESERQSIAAAGRARCVPAYSYDERMKVLLDYHVRNSS